MKSKRKRTPRRTPMSDSGHATDRTDWTVIAECPEGGSDHLTLEADATNADIGPRKAIPIKECPVCGAELDIIRQESPTEVCR